MVLLDHARAALACTQALSSLHIGALLGVC